jgi:hypothetical protein
MGDVSPWADKIVPVNAPEEQTPTDKHRITQAITRALEVYPGPIGEVAVKYLSEYIDFGYRFQRNGLSERLVAQILGSELHHTQTTE